MLKKGTVSAIGIIIATVILLCTFCVPAAAYTPSSFEITAEACVLASIDTNAVIYEKNADEKLFPASLTKIMTAAVVLDECASPESEKITVTEEALMPLMGTDSAVFGLKVNEEFTVLDMLYVMLVHSANDAANAFAVKYGNGSISDFVTKMNNKAVSLGMLNTHFVNPHGLQNENHYTTARDMYILTSEMLKNETFKKIVGTVRYSLPATNLSGPRTVATTVFLQDPNCPVQDYYYRYADGVKTGYTDEAGRCLISTATKNGISYICVLLKCPVRENGVMVRREFTDSKKLYNWVFSDFEYKQVYDDVTPVGESPVELGKGYDHVPLCLKHQVSAVLPKTADNSTVKVDIKLNSEVATAPIEKGQVLGTATIKYAGNDVETVEVVALNAVERNEFLAAIKFLMNIISSKIFKTVLLIIVILVVLFIVWCAYLNRKRNRRRKKYKRYKK